MNSACSLTVIIDDELQAMAQLALENLQAAFGGTHNHKDLLTARWISSFSNRIGRCWRDLHRTRIHARRLRTEEDGLSDVVESDPTVLISLSDWQDEQCSRPVIAPDLR